MWGIGTRIHLKSAFLASGHDKIVICCWSDVKSTHEQSYLQ
jgi:hypothetical protein